MTGVRTSEVEPELSVIVLADSDDALRPLAKALVAQTAAAELEIVVAAPGALHASIERLLEGPFHSVTALDLDPGSVGMSVAKAAGVRVAASDLVVFTETHCFPEGDWARCLIGAHRQGAAVMGPVFVNANPDSLVSTAGFIAHYGTFADPPPPPPRSDLPGNNGCYQRTLLLELDDLLVPMIEFEYGLHSHLSQQGHELVLVEDARVHHFNVSKWGASFREARLAGRVFGSSRSIDWPLRKRIGYAAAWPLITLVRTRRHRQDARRLGLGSGAVMTAVLALELAASSFGEALGYLFGEGRSGAPLDRMELRRDLFCTGRESSERRWFEEMGR